MSPAGDSPAAPGKPAMLGDNLVAIGMVAAAGILIHGTYFSGRSMTQESSPAVYPTAVAFLLVTFAALLVAGARRDAVAAGPKPRIPLAVPVAMVGLVAYVFAIGWLGYFPATLIASAGFAYLAGERRVWMLVLVAAGLTGAIALGFGEILRVPLPGGRLFE